MSIHYECDDCQWRYYPHCICAEVLTAQTKVLKQAIDNAELTFRSDIINPVRDIVEPILWRIDAELDS